MKKIKRYRLGVSRNFPTTHPKKGEPTRFIEKIEIGLENDRGSVLDLWAKLHTIRANYPLWEKRMKAVQAGEAVIELFYWSGSPYNSKRDGSKQVVFATLDKDSGCGVQKLEFEEMIMTSSPVLITKYKGLERIFRPKQKIELSDLAKNDGLSLDNFKAWFKDYDLSEPMGIIQFTKFRY